MNRFKLVSTFVASDAGVPRWLMVCALGFARTIIGIAVLFATAMLLAGFVLMVPSLTGKFAHGYVMASPFLGALEYGVVLLFVWSLFEYGGNKFAFIRRHEIMFLVMLSLLVHFVLLALLPAMVHVKNTMTHDPFLVLKSMESGRVCFMHAARNTGWCNYEILMSALAILFNGSLEFGRIVQAGFCAITLIPIFYMSKRVAGQRLARFVTLSLCLSPTIVMYSMVLTSEFIAASLMCFSAYFVMNSVINDSLESHNVLAMVVGGVALGLSDMFKVIAIVYIVVFIVALMIVAACRGTCKTFLRMAVIGIIVLLSYGLSRHIGQDVLSELAGRPELKTAPQESSSLLYELALGLDIEKEGFWNEKLATDFLKMSKEKRQAYVRVALHRDWKKYPMLMIRKFRNIHGSNNYHGGAVSSFMYMFKDSKNKWRVPKWVGPLADYGTTFFKVVFFLGTIGLLFATRKSISFWLPGLFAVSVVLVFAGIEQLIEGHGRYKMAIYPFYFMVTSYICVWFEKDNPLYVRIRKMSRNLRERIARCHGC